MTFPQITPDMIKYTELSMKLDYYGNLIVAIIIVGAISLFIFGCLVAVVMDWWEN